MCFDELQAEATNVRLFALILAARVDWYRLSRDTDSDQITDNHTRRATARF
jgi:hypothetical protein